MQTRRDFVKASSASLIGLALPGRAAAQSSNVVLKFQGLIAFAIARPKGVTGLPKQASRVTAMLVREAAHPNRTLIVPGGWIGAAVDRVEDITNCAVEIDLPAPGMVSLVTGKRSSTNGTPNPCGAPGEWDDVTWIANLEKICGQAEVHANALATPTTTSIVSARLTMTGGTLMGGPPSNKPNVNYAKQVWDMQPRPAVRYRQCFTDSVMWDAGAATCTIRIINPAGQTTSIPITASGGGQILVTNLPLPSAQNPDRTRSVHFKHYYKLLAAAAKPQSVPVMDSVCSSALPLNTTELAIQKFSDAQLFKARILSTAYGAGDPLYCENSVMFETV